MEEKVNSQGFVEVFNSLALEEVQLAETLLRSEDIMVTHSGVQGTQVFGRVQGLTQGVSLMVPAEEEKHALRLLRDAGYIPAADQTESIYTVGKSRKARSAKKQFWLYTAILVVLLIVVALLIYYL